MLKLDALQKYENALLENFSPSVLRELKRSNWNGLLREIDRLYATMYHEWDALQKDVVDIEDAVRSLTWTVNPYTRDGEEPGEYAKKVAQVVQEALWAKAPNEPGSVGHSFPQLLGALVHHRFRGFNVHQIVWKKAGNLIFPARYIQLPPQFMVWETKAGHPDRLLLVEDGASADGIPFPPHKYIVALNTSGPDHPLYNATFYSLVNWFVAFKFGLGWFMEYAQKYGMPKQVLHYANEKERQQLIDDLSDETVLNTILLKSGGSGEYDIKFPTGGSASLPQAVLLQKAEEACHKAILGQTLTSDTSAHGGSLAQAKVHAGVQADVVMKIAESVADILNQQLVPAILQANFGRVQGLPIPELRCKLPQAVASIERAQFLKTALEIPGMKVTKTEAYEYLNLTQPSDTDEVFEAKDPNAMGGGPGGGGFPSMGAGFPGGGKEAELPDAGAKDEVVTSAKAPAAPRDRNEAIKAWLSPLKKKLEEARSSGASLSDIRAQISAWKPDTRALAGALADNIANGLLGRTRGNADAANGDAEEVAAKHEKGCNQYSCKKGCKNKGTTRESKTKNQPLLFRVDPDATEHKQITQLMDVLEKAEEDGARYDAVIHRPEFGDLILQCGRKGKKLTKLKKAEKEAKEKGLKPPTSGGSGVKHALESRHHLSVKDMAETLIKGKVTQYGSRLEVDYNGKRVVLEKEIKQGTKRISQTKAKVISMRFI